MSHTGTRAKNHMGSVRQRPDGRWEGRYTDPHGGQRSVYGKTSDECTLALRAATHSVDTGKWLEPSKMTVGQWLDEWLLDYCVHVTGRTLETYRWVVEKRFKPALGQIPLQSLTKLQVRRFVNDMQRNGLSAGTIRHAKGILSSAMKCAVEAGAISVNPVENVPIPRAEPKSFRIVDRDLLPAFLEAAKQTECADVLVFLLMTGLRLGELRGLRWSDIDMERGVMRVERQLYSPSYSIREFRPPKDGSARDITLPADALTLLKRVRKQQLAQRVAAGSQWQEDSITRDLVFRRPDGRNYNAIFIQNAARAVGDSLGFEKFHPHDLRHSYAVAALRSGADVKTVQHNLGHKSAAMTLDIYAAYTTDAGKTSAQRFNDYWRDALN